MKISILMVLAGIIFISCGESQLTYNEYVEKEKKQIQEFIDKEDFEILVKYPDNGVFGEKQFVLLDNGCYLHVIDSGNGNRAISNQTIILMQCQMIDIESGKTLASDSEKPIKFTFGTLSNIFLLNLDKNSDEYFSLCEGVESALNYVSENAIVRMLVPFANSDLNKHTIGSLYQHDNMTPVYYKEISFQFEE